MKTRINDNHVWLQLSASDTSYWARQWPCSKLADRSVTFEYDSNGLVDWSIVGYKADIDTNEINAIVADHLRNELPKDHKLWCVIIGQFEQKE